MLEPLKSNAEMCVWEDFRHYIWIVFQVLIDVSQFGKMFLYISHLIIFRYGMW